MGVEVLLRSQVTPILDTLCFQTTLEQRAHEGTEQPSMFRNYSRLVNHQHTEDNSYAAELRNIRHRDDIWRWTQGTEPILRGVPDAQIRPRPDPCFTGAELVEANSNSQGVWHREVAVRAADGTYTVKYDSHLCQGGSIETGMLDIHLRPIDEAPSLLFGGSAGRSSSKAYKHAYRKRKFV